MSSQNIYYFKLCYISARGELYASIKIANTLTHLNIMLQKKYYIEIYNILRTF